MLLDGHDHVPEDDLGGEGVAVVDHWLPIFPIPTVHCRGNYGPSILLILFSMS